MKRFENLEFVLFIVAWVCIFASIVINVIKHIK